VKAANPFSCCHILLFGEWLLEVVEEGCDARKCWLALTFYLDVKLDAGLANATEIGNLMQGSYEANTGTGDDWLTETHLVHTVVYHHFQVVHFDNLLASFKRIRKGARNGLGIVYVQRDACGGCFNKIPPQRQLDIKMHKKIIPCEYCGRILIDPELAGVKIETPNTDEKPKRKRISRRKKAEDAE
jgi:hypothetical protein